MTERKVHKIVCVHCTHTKGLGIPIENHNLHQDYAPTHKADITQLEMILALMDFPVFPDIKAQLKGRRFTNLKELITATHSIT